MKNVTLYYSPVLQCITSHLIAGLLILFSNTVFANPMQAAFLGQELNLIHNPDLAEGNLQIQFTSTVTSVAGISVTLSQITRETQQVERIHRVSDSNGKVSYETLKTGAGFGYMINYELPSQVTLAVKPFHLDEKKGFSAKIPVFPVSEDDSKLRLSVQYVLEFRENGFNGTAFLDVTNHSDVILSKKQKWIMPVPQGTAQVKLSEQTFGVMLQNDNQLAIDYPFSPHQTRAIEFSFFIPIHEKEFLFKHDLPFSISEHRIVLQALNNLDLSSNQFFSAKPLKHQNQQFIDIRMKNIEPRSITLHIGNLPYKTETSPLVIITFALAILVCVIPLFIRFKTKENYISAKELHQTKEKLIQKLKDLQSAEKAEGIEYQQTLHQLSQLLHFIDSQKST